MAISTQVATAIPLCVFTAFSLVPKNALMRKCCLIQLKNSSTCQRSRYSSPTVSGGSAVLLVRNVMRLARISKKLPASCSACSRAKSR